MKKQDSYFVVDNPTPAEYRSVKRKKVVVGHVYCDLLGARLVYVGKHRSDDGDKCLCFYPLNEIANFYFKEKDGTVCFLDTASFNIYEEI